MRENKKGKSGLSRIWNSLWNADEKDPNEIEDPDKTTPEVGIFFSTVEQQREYHKNLQVKVKQRGTQKQSQSRSVGKNEQQRGRNVSEDRDREDK